MPTSVLSPESDDAMYSHLPHMLLSSLFVRFAGARKRSPPENLQYLDHESLGVGA